MLKTTILIISLLNIRQTKARECSNVGNLQVFYDPTCLNGGIGCNAGGQGQECRFCGFGEMIPCPGGISHSTPKPNTERPTNTNRPPNNSDVRFRTINKCSFPVWVGMQGISKSNGGWRLPFNGGWELESGQTQEIFVPYDFTAGRFWPRTNCKTVNGQFRCETGDCGPWVQCAHDGIQRGGQTPVSLAEFTLVRETHDYYDVSLVDGFNIEIAIVPNNRNAPKPSHTDPNYWCKAPECQRDLKTICPQELKKFNSQNHVIACSSACDKFRTDEYCCHGAHDRPETCRSTDWPVNYPAIFKQACPDAYSYAYDDHTSTYFCKDTSYDIVFC